MNDRAHQARRIMAVWAQRCAFIALLMTALTWPGSGHTQSPVPAPGEWRAYGATELATRYAPLDQIDGGNVKSLESAWRWRFDNFGIPSETVSTETTPIMVAGVLYFTAGARRTVVAVDAGTGETLWTWRPDEGRRFENAARRVSPAMRRG
jgi:quinoprotein glucose dehydrogenase